MVERLQLLINFYNLTASNFADKIDVPRSSISHLLSGRNKPSLDFVMKVVEAFDEVDLNWMIYGKGSFPSKGTQEIINTPKLESPTLFSELETKVETPKPQIQPKQEKNEVLVEKHENTINTPKPNNISSEAFLGNGKKLKKVVLLYNDGSFEEYNQ